MSAPIHIITIKSFSSMKDAYAALTDLYARFKAVHKRAEKVDLFIASSGNPKERETVEIRAHFTRENEADARWFEMEGKR